MTNVIQQILMLCIPGKGNAFLRDGSYDYVSFRIETNPKGERAAALHT